MEVNQTVLRIIKNVETVIRGKRDVIEIALTPLLSGGHLIFQDVPGVGKSTLSEAIARSIDATFSRIQFTSDLLPADIIGITIFNKVTNQFEFKKGPIFANIVLADEINRASPKTQSSLLEAMNEGTVTVDGVTYDLPAPFMVIATENPLEFAGTYPLPESELDRFMISLNMGYPPKHIEKEVIKEKSLHNDVKKLESVATIEEIEMLKKEAAKVYVEDSIIDYIMSIIQKTRESDLIEIGVSTRGGIDLLKAVKSYAFIKGRDFVIPDDVKSIAPFALSHRIVTKSDDKKFAKEIILQTLKEVPVPI